MVTQADLQVETLGTARFDSPIRGYLGVRRTNEHYVDEDDRVLLVDTVSQLASAQGEHPSLEPGGPRRTLFFEPGNTRVGLVTCGGLCPGLNDVIRGLVMELAKHYAVPSVTGFRHGFAGLVPGSAFEPMTLTPAVVHDIHTSGGTMLGSSRGAQDPDLMVDTLLDKRIDILFVVGGDGSIRGAAGIAAAVRRRGLPISVIAVPKTIDNDIPYIGQSFGFSTAFAEAARSINAAMIEARSAINGVGLVKLMGRHSGFIACYAALANHEADFVLIPEVRFELHTEWGLLRSLYDRVSARGHAVVVVAEGAGQHLISGDGTDPSGNAVLGDIGTMLKRETVQYFSSRNTPVTVKYMDPGYQIRSVPANAHDSVYCVRLAQVAVHAGMAGRTNMVVGRRHNRFVHVPTAVVTASRNEVAVDGDLWLSVLESTAQPISME